MSDISKIRVGGIDYTIKDADARAALLLKAPIASPSFTGTPLVPTPDINTDNTQIANTAWVNDRIDAAIAASDAMIFKGTIGKAGATITTKTLPNSTAKTGWTYKAVEAGDYTVGTGTGTGTTTVKCEVGDMIIALSNGSSSTYATWVVVQANIDGAVTGPASATANHIATFDGTSGKIIKDSGFTIATSVPANAVFTDQSVDSAIHHYTPAYSSTTSASGATGTSGTTIQVVTGIKLDAKGHVTGVTSGAATDTTYSAGTGLTKSGTTFNHSNSITAGSTPISIGINADDNLEFAGVRLFDAQGHATNTTTGGGVYGAALSIDGASFNRSVSITPAGSVSQPTFSGNSLTSTGSCTPRGYVAVDFGTGTFGSHFLQVQGTVSKPNITVSPTSESTLTSVKTAGTLPTWSASVSGETLSFSFNAGAMPTFNTGNRLTGASAALASTPEFVGGYIYCDATFHGSSTNVSVTGTPSGTVSKPSFTGATKTLRVAMRDFGSV